MRKRKFSFCVRPIQWKTDCALKFSRINKQKFKQDFGDTINPMSSCGTEVETTEHFLLRCHFCSTQRSKLFDKLEKVGPIFLNLNAKDKVLVLLYRSKTNNSKTFNKIVSLKRGFGGHGHEFGRFSGFN